MCTRSSWNMCMIHCDCGRGKEVLIAVIYYIVFECRQMQKLVKLYMITWYKDAGSLNRQSDLKLSFPFTYFTLISREMLQEALLRLALMLPASCFRIPLCCEWSMVVCTSTFVSPKGRHDGMGGCRMVSRKMTTEFMEFPFFEEVRRHKNNEMTLVCVSVLFSCYFDLFSCFWLFFW